MATDYQVERTREALIDIGERLVDQLEQINEKLDLNREMLEGIHAKLHDIYMRR